MDFRIADTFTDSLARLTGDEQKTEGSLLLCYVDHHDKAYDWAERRRLETHPKTGAAQLVEICETVKEVVMPVYVQADMARGGLKERGLVTQAAVFTALASALVRSKNPPFDFAVAVMAGDDEIIPFIL